ncbi:hypothetical protein BKA80DRAFT_272927 [Phyllosticta citrichinensis]
MRAVRPRSSRDSSLCGFRRTAPHHRRRGRQAMFSYASKQNALSETPGIHHGLPYHYRLPEASRECTQAAALPLPTCPGRWPSRSNMSLASPSEEHSAARGREKSSPEICIHPTIRTVSRVPATHSLAQRISEKPPQWDRKSFWIYLQQWIAAP